MPKKAPRWLLKRESQAEILSYTLVDNKDTGIFHQQVSIYLLWRRQDVEKYIVLLLNDYGEPQVRRSFSEHKDALDCLERLYRKAQEDVISPIYLK